MIDLKKSILPQAIEVGGSFYKIHTDFKYILRFRELLKTKPGELGDFDFIYKDIIPPDRMAGVKAVIDFINPPQELPRKTGNESGEIVLDYDTDAPYIYAAFMEQYKIDIIETPLHWYKFISLLHGLHNTELNRIISARLWTPSGKNTEYEKQQQRQHDAWALPQPEDNEPDEALNNFISQITR